MTARRRVPRVPARELTAEEQERRSTIAAAARTICDLTMFSGASPATAYLVAAELAYHLEDPELRPRRWHR